MNERRFYFVAMCFFTTSCAKNSYLIGYLPPFIESKKIQ